MAKDFADKNIDYEDSQFIVGNSAAAHAASFWTPKPKDNTENERAVNSDAYAMVNIMPFSLRTWKDGKAVPINVNAYRILTNVGSRYISGIPAGAADLSEFDYEFTADTIEYCAGSEKLSRGNYSTFVATGKPYGNYFSAKVISENSETQELKAERQKEIGDEAGVNCIYLIVETKNHQMDRGYYKVGYTIKPVAKVPAWVEKRNASTITALSESNVPGRLVRVMNLKSIYRDIDNAFNSVNDRAIYRGAFYLVKSK